MVTFQIQLPEANKDAVVQILLSLQSVGVIKSFNSRENIVTPGTPLAIEKLMELLADSQQQGHEGFTFSTEEAKTFLKAWRLRKR